jgi:hypothetical protein
MQYLIDNLFPISSSSLDFGQQDLVFLWRPFAAIKARVQKVLPTLRTFFMESKNRNVSNLWWSDAK